MTLYADSLCHYVIVTEANAKYLLAVCISNLIQVLKDIFVFVITVMFDTKMELNSTSSKNCLIKSMTDP